MENTNNDRPPAMLMSRDDPEIHRLKAQFVALAQGLMDQGETRQNVVYALTDTIIDLLANEHMKGNEEFIWTRTYLRDYEDGFNDWGRFMDLIDDMADEIERSRDAGGTGNPYQ